MKIIGLTGGIASGKSTVSAYLRELGIPVFDADAASRECVGKGTQGLAKALKALGAEYAATDGSLDRSRVARLVFSDDSARRRLEAIIHAEVKRAQNDFLRKNEADGAKFVVLDVPLLIETGWHEECDEVWLVALSVEKQIRRAMQRDGSTREQVERRIAKQMSLNEKRRYADFVIDNGGTPAETRKQVKKRIAAMDAATDGGAG